MPPVICYSLEEAAEKLSVSETVLVRLSQYFKVPEVAYEETGFLSFRGDLSFTDRDLHFFREVRERLLAGYSLEQLRTFFSQQAMSHQQSLVEPVKNRSEEGRPEEVLENLLETEETKPFQTYIHADALPSSSRPIMMAEMEDTRPLQKMAEKTFAKYKNIHQPKRQPDVLKNLAKEIQTASPPTSLPLSSVTRQPEFKPLKQAVSTPYVTAPKSVSSVAPPVPEPKSAAALPIPETIEWTALLMNAKRRAIPLSDALSQAATELRYQASQGYFS